MIVLDYIIYQNKNKVKKEEDTPKKFLKKQKILINQIKKLMKKKKN